MGCVYWKNCKAKDPFYIPEFEIFSFEKTFDEPQLKVEDVTTEYDNETLILYLKAKNGECLVDKLKVTYIEPKRIVQRIHMENKIDLRKLMPKRNECVEYQVKLEISSVLSSVFWSGLFNSTMTVGLPRVENGMLKFEIDEDVYKKCKNITNLFVNCTSKDGNITMFENEGLSLEQSRVQGLFCRAKAYNRMSFNSTISEDLNFKRFSACFTDTGTPCPEERSNSPVLIGVGSVVGALAVAFIIVAKIRNRTRSVVYHKIKTDSSPSHIIFKNSETLPVDLDTAAALQGELGDEFKKLEMHVKNHIDDDETMEVAKSELNCRRNRYQDMVPYDSNLVVLTKETGELKMYLSFTLYIISRESKI